MEGLLALIIDLAVMLYLIPDKLVLLVVGVHSACLVDMLKTKDTVADIGVCNGTEIIPLGSALVVLDIVQDVKGFLIASHLHIDYIQMSQLPNNG